MARKIKMKTGDVITLLEATNIPPKELTDLNKMRKLNSAREVLREATKKYFDKMDALKVEAEKIIDPFKTRLTGLATAFKAESDAAKKSVIQGEMDGLQDEANQLLKPSNEKIAKLQEDADKKEVEFEMDGNYLTELQDQYKKHGMANITKMDIVIRIADALEIE